MCRWLVKDHSAGEQRESAKRVEWHLQSLQQMAAGVKGEGMASGLSANNWADQISVVVVELRLSARVAKGRGFDSPGYIIFFSLIPVGRTHCEGVES